MGGANSAPIIGYKYYLGVHFVPCLGPVDAVTAIEVDKRVAWRGNATGGRIVVDAPELFGGESREGGVSGYLDILPGDAAQGVNDYLQGWLGGIVPAFRRVLSVVLRQAYIGNNPYLKPWAFQVQRVFTGDQGAPQWYPEKAGIETGFGVGDAGIYIALDVSGSMSGARMAAQKQAVIEMLEAMRDESTAPNSVRIVLWQFSIVNSIQRDDATTADYNDLIAWVDGLSNVTDGGTDFGVAVSQAEDFFLGGAISDPLELGDPFDVSQDWGQVGDWWRSGEELPGTGTKRRIIIFVTDGEPSDTGTVATAVAAIEAIEAVEVYGFNIALEDTQYTAQLDNTQADGVPVVTPGDPSALRAAFESAFAYGLDMNPAHILREVLIATDTGGSGDESEIGPSFAAAADQLFAERFGLSLFWKNPRDRASFLSLVERHIDANCYIDRATGKWGLRLIRDDYDLAELPVFDRSNVASWSGVTWPDTAELPNQITLVYHDRAKDEAASVTITNVARVQAIGRVINQKVEYEGIGRHDLATQVALRDLRAISNPLLSGTLRAPNVPLDINRGSPILLNNPRLGIVNVVARVTELTEGDGRDNAVEIRFVEDKFRFSTDVLVAAPTDRPADVINAARAAEIRLVEEAPYYEVVRMLGQTEADTRLASAPLAGWLNFSAKAPTSDAIDAVATVDAGGGYFDTASIDFAPGGVLLSSLSADADHVKVMIERSPALARVAVESLAKIGDEYLRVDAIASTCGFYSLDRFYARDRFYGVGAVVTFGRGCLDTVPAPHAAGAGVLFWSESSGSDGVEYIAGEAIDVKLRPRTGKGALSVSAAPVDVVQFDQRALRPYPPGKLQVNGQYRTALYADGVSVSWANRDRVSQTTGVFDDFTQGDIGPENGVRYVVTVRAIDGSGGVLDELMRREVGQATSLTISPNDLADRFYPQAFYARDYFYTASRFYPTPFYSRARFYGGLTAAVAAIEISVEAWRDGLRCRQVPKLNAQIFRAPINLTIEEI